MPLPPEKRCTHRTPKGTQCRAARRKDGEYCIFHDTDFRERAEELRAAKAVFERRRTPDTAEGIHALLGRTADAVLHRKISPRVANSVGFLSQAMMLNLDRLHTEREKLTPSARREETDENLVDNLLDQIEKEIDEAGESAYPVSAAQLAAREFPRARKPRAVRAKPNGNGTPTDGNGGATSH